MAHATFPGPAAPRTGPDHGRRQSSRSGHGARDAIPTANLTALGLPQLFSPMQAAEILRELGLTEMTECALRTRVYRRQIPFHRNGRQIRFTLSDLREIAEGQEQRPDPRSSTRPTARPTPTQPAHRRSAARTAEPTPIRWRARASSGKPAPSAENL